MNKLLLSAIFLVTTSLMALGNPPSLALVQFHARNNTITISRGPGQTETKQVDEPVVPKNYAAYSEKLLAIFTSLYAEGYEVDFLKDKTDAVLKEMASVFISKDPLLKSAGMITVYYHLFRMIVSKALTVNVSRVDLMNFEQLRISNKNTAEQDIALADYSLLEFDRYAQTPNDAFANRLKLEVLLKYAFNIVLKKPLEIFS